MCSVRLDVLSWLEPIAWKLVLKILVVAICKESVRSANVQLVAVDGLRIDVPRVCPADVWIWVVDCATNLGVDTIQHRNWNERVDGADLFVWHRGRPRILSAAASGVAFNRSSRVAVADALPPPKPPHAATFARHWTGMWQLI